MKKELSIRLLDINNTHEKINQGLKVTVSLAIRLGMLLVEIKEELPHGDFIAWINDNCVFSERTARNYISLFRHRVKTAVVADLQEAYKLVESEEQKEKRLKEVEQNHRIKLREETGVKPDDWNRADEYAWQKKLDNLASLEKNKDTTSATIKGQNDDLADINSEIDEFFTAQIGEEVKPSNAKISDEGNSIIGLLSIYFNRLVDDERRIKSCKTIADYCKEMIIELEG